MTLFGKAPLPCGEPNLTRILTLKVSVLSLNQSPRDIKLVAATVSYRIGGNELNYLSVHLGHCFDCLSMRAHEDKSSSSTRAVELG